MPNYQQAKVYKIWSPSTERTYYGSTCQPLSRRMASHRSSYRKGKNTTTSKHVLEANDAIIVLVEACPCNNKEELKAHEARYIKDNECVNKQVPGRTKVEYDRAYYQANREAINARQREKFNCPCGGKYIRCLKSSHEKTRKHQAWVAQQQQQ